MYSCWLLSTLLASLLCGSISTKVGNLLNRMGRFQHKGRTPVNNLLHGLKSPLFTQSVTTNSVADAERLGKYHTELFRSKLSNLKTEESISTTAEALAQDLSESPLLRSLIVTKAGELGLIRISKSRAKLVEIQEKYLSIIQPLEGVKWEEMQRDQRLAYFSSLELGLDTLSKFQKIGEEIERHLEEAIQTTAQSSDSILQDCGRDIGSLTAAHMGGLWEEGKLVHHALSLRRASLGEAIYSPVSSHSDGPSPVSFPSSSISFDFNDRVEAFVQALDRVSLNLALRVSEAEGRGDGRRTPSVWRGENVLYGRMCKGLASVQGDEYAIVKGLFPTIRSEFRRIEMDSKEEDKRSQSVLFCRSLF